MTTLLPIGYPLGRDASPGVHFSVRCGERFVQLDEPVYQSWWDARRSSRGSPGLAANHRAELLELGLLAGGDDLLGYAPVAAGIGQGRGDDDLFTICDHRLEPLCRVDALTYSVWAAAGGRAPLAAFVAGYATTQGYDPEQFKLRLTVIVQNLMNFVALFLDDV